MTRRSTRPHFRTQRLVRHVVDRHTHARHDEHGDIPGWVMITVMTITVASAIGLLFAPAVTAYLQSALAQFK